MSSLVTHVYYTFTVQSFTIMCSVLLHCKEWNHNYRYYKHNQTFYVCSIMLNHACWDNYYTEAYIYINFFEWCEANLAIAWKVKSIKKGSRLLTLYFDSGDKVSIGNNKVLGNNISNKLYIYRMSNLLIVWEKCVWWLRSHQEDKKVKYLLIQ